MPVTALPVQTFLEEIEVAPAIDVRSPAEYSHARILSSVNIPLFSNDERKTVGTAYKQVSREKAIRIGLDYFGPKMRPIVEQCEMLCEAAGTRRLFVHCWRGGMRSGAIAWLLDLYGFEVSVLEGGYKAYRQWVLNILEQQHPLVVVGGYTGTGKTRLLHELERQGEATLDLEALAGHRGSAFGNLGLPPQPSAEQVENNLAHALFRIYRKCLPNRPDRIWVEDESRRIGNINLHHKFYEHFIQAPFVFLDVPFEKRLELVENDYGHYPPELLVNSIGRITKRLGGQYAKAAIENVRVGDITGAFRILLHYYDKHYDRSSFENRKKYTRMNCYDTNAKALYLKLINDFKHSGIHAEEK